jgi:hypothetical protein
MIKENLTPRRLSLLGNKQKLKEGYLLCREG